MNDVTSKLIRIRYFLGRRTVHSNYIYTTIWPIDTIDLPSYNFINFFRKAK